jgi:cell wall-associated NlpC family hydrolase
MQGLISSITASTYPCEDADMLAAEAAYSAMEADLQVDLDDYESTHSYDEYHFELDAIEHDPYVLMSAITALHGGTWTIDEIGGILQTLFDKQYILTETVTTETRYRTETRTGYYVYTDPDTGESEVIEYEYDVQIPYTYYICNVKLENFNLSHVPVYIMSQDQLSMYAMYMATLGNRPDLFASSGYVGKYYNTEYEVYEIPPEALEDEQFAAMIAEAEKYLGYPYVWGGSSPSTSFDCSGFVSYVCNNCGVGWNFGRLGAEGLRGICTAVSKSNAKPGDLIFFQGTYDTAGASHVGIYVGNGMMIHCGDPIHYTSIETNYWQQHYLSMGRLPSP